MVCANSRILLSHIKEWSADTCSTLDEPQKSYAKWKEPDRKFLCFHLYEFVWFYLYEISRIDKSVET